MISKSLKVGDLFTDGNLQYEVISLTDKPGIYISKAVGKAPTANEVADKSAEEQEVKPVKKTRKKVIE